MSRIIVGIDNGVSGRVAIWAGKKMLDVPMPVKRELSYTKTKQWIHRIDWKSLESLLNSYVEEDAVVFLERPMVNPGRFKATMSALRALESTLQVLERLGLSVQYIDSKEWQKALLPSGLEKEELKAAAISIAERLYPYLKPVKDGDAICICEWARRQYGIDNTKVLDSEWN